MFKCNVYFALIIRDIISRNRKGLIQDLLSWLSAMPLVRSICILQIEIA